MVQQTDSKGREGKQNPTVENSLFVPILATTEQHLIFYYSLLLVQQTSTYHPSGGCLVWFGFTTSCGDEHRSRRRPNLPQFGRTEVGKSPALSDESTTQTSIEGDAAGNATTLYQERVLQLFFHRRSYCGIGGSGLLFGDPGCCW